MANDLQIDIRSIEILSSVINNPGDGRHITEFGFGLRFKSSPDLKNNIVTIVADAEIRDIAKGDEVGRYSALFRFEVAELSGIMKIVNQTSELPESLRTSLLSVSISTLRGLMFAAFRGTFLHNALLPLVDVDDLTQIH